MVKFNSVSNLHWWIIFFIKNKNNDFASFQNGVDTIVSGCTTYGSTPSSNTPSNIVNAIKAIYNNRYNAGVTATKKGNATASDVLSGKTFTNASSVGISGTMTNNGAISKTITPSANTQSYTIPKGYHNGSGKITVNPFNKDLDFSKFELVKTYTGVSGTTVVYNFVDNKQYLIVGCAANWGSQTQMRVKLTSSGCSIQYLLNNSINGDYSSTNGGLALTVARIYNVFSGSKITIDTYWLYQVKIFRINE